MELETFFRNLPRCSDVDELLDQLQELIVKGLGAASFQVYLLDEITGELVPCRSYPSRNLPRIPEIRDRGPLCEGRDVCRGEAPGIRLEELRLRYDPAAQAAIDRLHALGAEWAFPFCARAKLIGLLLIGGGKRKLNGRVSGEVQHLRLLAQHVNVAIDRLLLADELTLVGQMSRGMAHDLQSLLTPISTFLQLADEDCLLMESRAELLPVARRNLETIQAYIKQALVFTRRHKPQFRRVRLDLLLHRAVDLAETQWKQKGLSLKVRVPGETIAEVDEVLILRLVGNLLTNAIYAAPPHSSITIGLGRLKPSRTHGKRVQIRVTDAGKGIRSETLQRILSPAFARRLEAETEGRSGLGLAICRKICCLHGGTLDLISAAGRGTTAQVRLPVCQTGGVSRLWPARPLSPGEPPL